MANRLGQQLGNYKLIRLLGQGAFAEVYLGSHIYLNTLAAVKVLHTQLSDTDVQRFLTEARTVAHLVHPHIVRVLEFDVKENTAFLIMDYASNGTLRQRYPPSTKLSMFRVVEYIKQAASALQHAHEQKIIHRDIKPENMLLDPNDRLLLSDFGIALVSQSSRYTGTQDLAGTVGYMAPEQIQSHPRPASDQYSLGIVVYEWLSGERPFRGTFTEVALKHTLVPPPPLSEKVPNISPLVEQVVMRALEKDSNQRFGSVWDFATALEGASNSDQPTILSPMPITPVSIPPLQKTRPTTDRSHIGDVSPPEAFPDEKHAASGNDNENSNIWRIGRQRGIAIVLGALVSGILVYIVDVAVKNFAVLSNPFNVTLFYYFAAANIFFCLLRLIPLFFGVTYGPWVGISAAVSGGLFGDYLSGRFSWSWTLGMALAGFIAGLALLKTRGRYSTNSSIATAVMIAAIAIAIGLAVPIYGNIWLSGISVLEASHIYLVETLPTIFLVMVLLPLLLALYERIVERRRSLLTSL